MPPMAWGALSLAIVSFLFIGLGVLFTPVPGVGAAFAFTAPLLTGEHVARVFGNVFLRRGFILECVVEIRLVTLAGESARAQPSSAVATGADVGNGG